MPDVVLISLSRFALSLLLIVTIFAWSVSAQSPCLYAPHQIERLSADPAPIVIWTNPSGTPLLVEARSYIRQVRAIDRTEAAAAAVQYSIIRQGIDPRAISIRAYVPDGPALSLYAVGWRYLWTGNLPERDRMGALLLAAIEHGACQEGGRSYE